MSNISFTDNKNIFISFQNAYTYTNILNVLLLPLQPSAVDTIAPTSVPDGSAYYIGFEQGDFPFSRDSTDTEWQTANDEDPSKVWELTKERANNGTFSLKTPNLQTESMAKSSANLTLFLSADYGTVGTLYYSMLTGAQNPFDIILVAVDGVERRAIRSNDPNTAFERFNETGVRSRIDFIYRFNPFNVAPGGFPPEDAFPNRTGVVYVDDVYYVPLGSSSYPEPV